MSKKNDKLPKGFSLYARANGQYAKKISGNLHYFGVIADPHAAWKKYLDQKDDLQAGRTPKKADDERLTIEQLCNQFLASKDAKTVTGELSQRMFHSYQDVCQKLADHFGKNRIVEELRATDFVALRSSFAKGVGLVRLGNLVQHARIVFKYAYDSELIEKPLRFGQDFKKPPKRQLRAERQQKPKKLYTAVELNTIIDAAPQPIKAMVLLGINCGFGQTDCSQLPLKAVNLDASWLDFPRPKTAVPRRCPLWPETVAALREVLKTRPTPSGEEVADRFFLTSRGTEFVTFKANGSNQNGVSRQFDRLLVKLKLTGNGRTFYALRHTLESIGGGTKDQIAVDAIMGHTPADDDMGAVYREFVDDARLVDVVNHVRKWLWPRRKVMKLKSP